MTTCTLKRRKDDIPKYGKEASWSCETCGALIFAPLKPQCRQAMLNVVKARHASAEAEAHILHLDEKVKPQ